MKHTRQDLKIMQSLSLEEKIRKTQAKIMEWYLHYDGKVYVSFSGGKDSTVLLDLARRVFPDIEAVFCDTGLEYPEVREFAMNKENVTPIKPIKYDRKQRKFIPTNFREVVEIYGYPVIGKEVAKHVYYCRKGSPFALKCLEGLNTDGTPSKFRSRYKKYKFLTTAPFTISNRCCDIIKKHPLKQYERKTQNKPIIATMAYESQQRESGWLKTGCNAFGNGRSQPMSFWTEQDVLHYLKITGIPYASVYGDIIEKGGQTSLFESESTPLMTTGCERTGCMFCMFGIMNDKTPNRFQRMKQTHPKLYKYCIDGGYYDENGMLKPDNHGLGIGKVLDYIGIPY